MRTLALVKPGFPIPFHSLVISGPCPGKKSRTQRSQFALEVAATEVLVV
jgi:hypothetical protein